MIYRQGPAVTTTDNYNDGILRFAVASGAQSTANGSSSGNAGRAGLELRLLDRDRAQ